MLVKILRRIPKRTLAILTLGLLLAFAGGAFAGSKITGAMIQNGTVTGSDIKDHSLTHRDFRGNLRGPRGKRGRQGIQGVQGPTGPKGDTGATPKVSMLRTSQLATIPAGAITRVETRCPGETVTGGGYQIGSGDPKIIDENDAWSQNGWFVRVDNSASQDQALITVFAYCLLQTG